MSTEKRPRTMVAKRATGRTHYQFQRSEALIMDENAKKKGLRMIPYGLQILGAKNGDKQTVATINWTTQASFQPPLVVVGIKTDSTAHDLVKQSKKFTLSMLGAGQKDLAM